MAYRGKFRKKLTRTQLLSLVFLAAFLCVGCFSLRQLLRPGQEQDALQRLAQSVQRAETSASYEASRQEQPGKDTEAQPQPLSQYAALARQNPDFYGWVRIPGTVLDYPVMHTPEDPEYYIHRDFEGQGSISGVPFLAGGCRFGSGNAIVYGHNMENGSMFHELLSYAREDYWQEHPIVEFDTLYQEGRYQVFSAFYTEAYPPDRTNVFRVYDHTDLQQEAAYDAFVRQAVEASLYPTGLVPEYGSSLVTLITCSYHRENGRFVVIGAAIE